MKTGKHYVLSLTLVLVWLSHAMTPRHPYFAFLAVIETPATPPTAGSITYNKLIMRPLRRSVHRGARSTTSNHHHKIIHICA